MPVSSNPFSSYLCFYDCVGCFLVALHSCLGLCARLGGSVVTVRFTRLIASTMIEHARALALPSVYLHACAGRVAYFVRTFPWGFWRKSYLEALPSKLIFKLAMFFRFWLQTFSLASILAHRQSCGIFGLVSQPDLSFVTILRSFSSYFNSFFHGVRRFTQFPTISNCFNNSTIYVCVEWVLRLVHFHVQGLVP